MEKRGKNWKGWLAFWVNSHVGYQSHEGGGAKWPYMDVGWPKWARNCMPRIMEPMMHAHQMTWHMSPFPNDVDILFRMGFGHHPLWKELPSGLMVFGVSSLSPSSKHGGWWQWQWHSHSSIPSIMPHLDFDGSSISIIIIINVDASPSGMPMWHVTIGQCAHMCIPSGTLFKKNLGNFFFSLDGCRSLSGLTRVMLRWVSLVQLSWFLDADLSCEGKSIPESLRILIFTWVVTIKISPPP